MIVLHMGMVPCIRIEESNKMKNKFTIVALMVFTLLSTAAFAASNTQKVNVPFEFHLGDKVMPAGSYTISALTAQTLLIRSEDKAVQQRVALTFQAERSTSDHEAKLVFRHIGDQYFLVQVWGTGTESGRAILTSRAQEQMARNTSSSVVMGSK